MNCQGCREGESRDVILIGGFNTCLCLKCRDAWHEYVIKTENFRRRECLVIDLIITIENKDNDCAHKIAEEIRAIDQDLYKRGKYFIEGLSKNWKLD